MTKTQIEAISKASCELCSPDGMGIILSVYADGTFYSHHEPHHHSERIRSNGIKEYRLFCVTQPCDVEGISDIVDASQVRANYLSRQLDKALASMAANSKRTHQQ